MPSTSSDYVYRPVQHDPSMPYTRPAVSPAALTRVQVLTPLSILISAGALIITSTLTKPKLGDVSSKHPTYITPSATWLMAYWATLYILQIGFALLCVVGQKTETKVSESKKWRGESRRRERQNSARCLGVSSTDAPLCSSCTSTEAHCQWRWRPTCSGQLPDGHLGCYMGH